MTNAALSGIGAAIAEDLTINKFFFGTSITELLLNKVKHNLYEYGKKKAERELIPKLASVAFNGIVLDPDLYDIT